MMGTYLQVCLSVIHDLKHAEGVVVGGDGFALPLLGRSDHQGLVILVIVVIFVVVVIVLVVASAVVMEVGAGRVAVGAYKKKG